MYHDEKFISCGGYNLVLKKISKDYKNSCRKETKRELNDMINNFVDDDDIDKAYKDKIIDIIVGLLTLKQS